LNGTDHRALENGHGIGIEIGIRAARHRQLWVGDRGSSFQKAQHLTWDILVGLGIRSRFHSMIYFNMVVYICGGNVLTPFRTHAHALTRICASKSRPIPQTAS
jgi:hypothetical protein